MATTTRKQSYIVGLADTYIRAHATPLNDNPPGTPITGNTVSFTSWTALSKGKANTEGADSAFETEAGAISWEYSNEINFLEPPEELGPIDWTRRRETLRVFLTLQSRNIVTLLHIIQGTFAEGAAAGTDPNTFVFGGDKTKQEWAIAFEALGAIGVGAGSPSATANSSLVGYIPRCIPVGVVTQQMHVSDPSLMVFEFRAIHHNSATQGQELMELTELTVT